MTVKIGASPVPHAEILAFIRDNLAPAAGLELEIVEFTDYVLPNLALMDGTLEANYFQHLPYLEDFNAQKGTDLIAVADVHIEPLGIYSRTLSSLNDLSDGAVVLIPNDATNGGRALNLLAANGLITLKQDAGFKATVLDIQENPKNLKITELEAAQLVRSLEDASLAVINGNYALEGGLTPAKDALALESAENNPYVNILAVKRGNENLPAIQKLIALLTSPEVKAFIEEKYAGSVLPAFGN
ncbi:MAG TPA: MetQ/NlpA family ABC transporter substrate-binding protein [Anaerolineaceae bacterium]|nr:MetQ/NlpA family ABC transporter substrate-binding protein [Anaerolineaceae bacterium]